MSRGGNDRGRPHRGGRYYARGRGGANRGGSGNNRGRGRGVPGYTITDEFDFPIQQWSNPDEIQHNVPSVANNQRGFRGRGRGASIYQQNSGSSTPRRGGEGPNYSPRDGRGRGDGIYDHHQSPRGGRGRGGPKLRHDAPLSKLLYQERPFLKPIIFVPSMYTRKLFEEQEDLVKPQVKDVADTETSHIPTADRITRIFSGGNIPRQDESASEDDAVEVADMLEEIDFEDMARIREEVDAAAGTDTIMGQVSLAVVEERFTGVIPNRAASTVAQEDEHMSHPSDDINETMGFYIDTKPSPIEAFVSTEETLELKAEEMPEPEPAGFYIDTTPVVRKEHPFAVGHIAKSFLGADDDDDEIIVYVAPHPRKSMAAQVASESQAAPSLPSTSILTGTTSAFTSTTTITAPSAEPANPSEDRETLLPTIPNPPAFNSISKFVFDSPATKQPRIRPTFTLRERAKAKAKAHKKDARATRQKLERRAMFGSFGAIVSEAQLRDGEGPDPRWEERRRGDSDIDWGDTDEDVLVGVDGVDEISNGMGGMELDGDIDLNAMKAFVKGMSSNGGRYVTMDDIADTEQMRLEDEAMTSGGRRGESGDDESESEEVGSEVKVVFDEEVAMMGEARDMSPSDSDDDVVDQSPNTGFQTRLHRLREKTRGKKVVDAEHSSDEGTSEDDFFDGPTRGEEDDNFIAGINAILDEKGGPISNDEREARNRLFRAVHNGDFSDDEGILPAKCKKDKNFSPQLQEQWEKDRARKAEIKRVRTQARLDAAADALAVKKGGKKGHKAMLAAAKFDPSIIVPERIVDMFTVEQQIRRFLENIGGKQTMVLPPMGKQSRAQVHELALAFNLKSQSKGKGKGRYPTLTKTTRSGFGINEGKIRRIVKGGGGFMAPGFGGGAKGGSAMPRHKEGDEVGKAAPKIGESNIGFKMLALMGWAEGDRIGTSGGLDAPLTAVIKNTKLGLGANR